MTCVTPATARDCSDASAAQQPAPAARPAPHGDHQAGQRGGQQRAAAAHAGDRAEQRTTVEHRRASTTTSARRAPSGASTSGVDDRVVRQHGRQRGQAVRQVEQRGQRRAAARARPARRTSSWSAPSRRRSRQHGEGAAAAPRGAIAGSRPRPAAAAAPYRLTSSVDRARPRRSRTPAQPKTAIRTSSGASVARVITVWMPRDALGQGVDHRCTALRRRGEPGHVAQHQVEAAGPGPRHHRHAVLAQLADRVLPFQPPEPVGHVVHGPRSGGDRRRRAACRPRPRSGRSGPAGPASPPSGRRPAG